MHENKFMPTPCDFVCSVVVHWRCLVILVKMVWAAGTTGTRTKWLGNLFTVWKRQWPTVTTRMLFDPREEKCDNKHVWQASPWQPLATQLLVLKRLHVVDLIVISMIGKVSVDWHVFHGSHAECWLPIFIGFDVWYDVLMRSCGFVRCLAIANT